MAIRVEFFGIARERAGTSELLVELRRAAAPLSNVLDEVAARLPELGRELIVDGQLHASLTANLDGACFVHDSATLIRDGQSLLILSADAGG